MRPSLVRYTPPCFAIVSYRSSTGVEESIYVEDESCCLSILTSLPGSVFGGEWRPRNGNSTGTGTFVFGFALSLGAVCLCGIPWELIVDARVGIKTSEMASRTAYLFPQPTIEPALVFPNHTQAPLLTHPKSDHVRVKDSGKCSDADASS